MKNYSLPADFFRQLAQEREYEEDDERRKEEEEDEQAAPPYPAARLVEDDAAEGAQVLDSRVGEAAPAVVPQSGDNVAPATPASDAVFSAAHARSTPKAMTDVHPLLLVSP